MENCRCECAYLGVIIGLIARVILGVLFALGFVATGIIFWVYLAIGVIVLLLLPIYSATEGVSSCNRCFCSYRKLIVIAALGAIITGAAGLVLSAVLSFTATAIILALSTFFAVLLIITVICLSKCICNN